MLKLDKIDLNILAALQRDGRMTKLRLAEAVNLSPTACWDRLNRMEEAGLIAGYAAKIDAPRLARFTTVLVEVALKSHHRGDFERFEATVLAEPAIIACDATGGGIDYLLRVVAPDIAAYQQLIDRLLADDIGIERYFSYVVTKTIKAGEIPVQQLAAMAAAG